MFGGAPAAGGRRTTAGGGWLDRCYRRTVPRLARRVSRARVSMADLGSLSEHARGLHGVPAQCVPRLRACCARSVEYSATLSQLTHAAESGLAPRHGSCCSVARVVPLSRDTLWSLHLHSRVARRAQLHSLLARRPHRLVPDRKHAGTLMVRLCASCAARSCVSSALCALLCVRACPCTRLLHGLTRSSEARC